MINNSTLLFIIDESTNENEIINIDELLDLKDDCQKELDDIFGIFNYSPSDEVVNRILRNV